MKLSKIKRLHHKLNSDLKLAEQTSFYTKLYQSYIRTGSH